MLRFFRSRDSGMSDDELLARFRQTGNAAHLAQLYDRYLELVYGLCLRYLGQPATAEDAVMGIYESLLAKVPQHEIRTFRSWLHTFSRNYCLMQLRQEKRSPLQNTDPALVQSDGSAHPVSGWPGMDNQQEDQVHDLRECLQGLNEDQRRCIELFYYQEYSYQDIAGQTKLALGRVRSHIQNGRRNLRICLEKKQQARQA